MVSSLHPSLDERSVQVAGGGQGVLGGGVLPVFYSMLLSLCHFIFSQIIYDMYW